MCGIDELFSSNSLEEKTESSQRFVQALDEHGAVGDFRYLLEKYFTSTWHRELDVTGSGNIQRTEEALKAAQKVDCLAGKITAFVQGIDGSHSGGWLQYGLLRADVYQMIQKRYPSRVAFAQACATQVFSESSYGFFQCFKAPQSTLEEFDIFILFFASPYFGENCHLTPLLFNDKQLEAVGESERRNILRAVFDCMNRCSFSGDQVQFNGSLAGNLKKLHAWETHASVPSREPLLCNESFDYLCAWVEAETRSREHSISLEELETKENTLFELEQEVFHHNRALTRCDEENKDFENWTTNWFREKRCALNKAWCCNVAPERLSDDAINVWALRSYDCFLPLCKDLNEQQTAHLIAWGIKEDLKKWLDPGFKSNSLLDSMLRSGMWYVSAYREAWRSQLINSINALPINKRLSVLGLRCGWAICFSPTLLPQYVLLPAEFYKEDEHVSYYEFLVDNNDHEWWNSLLRFLPHNASLPKELYPLWTSKALSRFGYCEDIVPHADKSLGIVRGNSQPGEIDLTTEIDEFIQVLERFSPEKAMRHRLLLLRSSQHPYATENLDIDRTSMCPKSMSEIVKRMAHLYISRSRDCSRSIEDWRIEEQKFLSSIRGWIANFCLSRLKLRKGEKVESGSYDPKQVVEQSPVWRKTYLKVLEELGVDPQGKAHKAVFFVRKYDPVDEVREVAKTCYKAVRRERNKSESAADIRRGLTAAYWWLLLAQRHALGLYINQEEAVKTRRRLLRRP